MRELIRQIIAQHQSKGIIINPPASLSDIADFEKQAGFPLPQDFKDFYLLCNGFRYVDEIFIMVPLPEIRQFQRDYGDNWFYFSEYLIYSDMWGLRFTPAGHYEIFNGYFPDKSMTSSLTEFLQRFLKGTLFEDGGIYDWQEELGIK